MNRLFAVAILLFLLGFQIVSAEITNPYTIDEKSQVLFGDSVATSTYQGLENYAHDYVGDYLHITFTYTHSGCCTASFPPKLYVTAYDPTGTTSPEIRDNYYVYALSPQPVHLTDVYSYDVQFDATGYTVKVNASNTDFTFAYTATTTEVTNFHKDIPGLTTSDWAALVNDSLKEDPVTQNSMAFTPLPIYDAPSIPQASVATTTPVIIVPGIMSSNLDINGSEIWPNLTGITFSITDSFLDDLSLNSNSESINSVNAPSVLRSLAGQDFFSGLFSSVESDGYIENVDIFEFPYDWRFDISTLATELKEKIDEVKAERGVEKVNLVAHSMGGLLVKKYLKNYGGDSVAKFVDIGTPHTGAPKAFKILNYGDNFGFEKVGLNFLNPLEVKSISQNMPSVYELLPSRDYFDGSDPRYSYYVYDDSDSSQFLSFDSTKRSLVSAGRNAALVEQADTFHQGIDGLDPADYGVTTYNIVGCGVPTIGQFYTFHDGDGESHNIRFIDGDGTVPLKSAEAVAAASTYYVRGIPHALLPSASGVRELVAAILTATSTDFDTSAYGSLSTSASGCAIPDGKIVSFHSPVTLDIYDTSGNHAGPDANGDIENDISGVSYETLGDEKFAFLPSGTEYTISGTGTDSGTLTVRIENVVSGEVTSTTIFTGIPVTSATKTEFALGTDSPDEIPIDADGDGTYESDYPVTVSVAGALETSGAATAGTLYSNSGVILDQASPVFPSERIEASGYENLTFSFNYEAETLDRGDSFLYGWSAGGTDHDLGVVSGVNEPSTPLDETGTVSAALPPEAQASDLTLYIRATVNSLSDEVDLTGIALTGDISEPEPEPESEPEPAAETVAIIEPEGSSRSPMLSEPRGEVLGAFTEALSPEEKEEKVEEIREEILTKAEELIRLFQAELDELKAGMPV